MMTCGCAWNIIGWKAINKAHVRRKEKYLSCILMWVHKQLEWRKKLHVKTQNAWALSCTGLSHTSTIYAPHVGIESKSNCLLINTRVQQERKTREFKLKINNHLFFLYKSQISFHHSHSSSYKSHKWVTTFLSELSWFYFASQTRFEFLQAKISRVYFST